MNLVYYLLDLFKLVFFCFSIPYIFSIEVAN